MKEIRNELYEKYSSTFKEYISSFTDKDIKRLNEKYRIQYLPILKSFGKNASILDLGCGRGMFLEFLLRYGYINSFGIDISGEQIEIAKSKNLRVEQMSVLEYLKNTNKKYDLIFAIDLIEHFHKDELVPLFRGVYNLLNENGALIFQTPNGLGINSNRIIYGDLTHMTIFTPASATQMLKLVGFSNIEFLETEPYAKNFFGAMRLVLWKIVKLFLNIIRLIETGGVEKILTQNFIGFAKK